MGEVSKEPQQLSVALNLGTRERQINKRWSKLRQADISQLPLKVQVELQKNYSSHHATQ